MNLLDSEKAEVLNEAMRLTKEKVAIHELINFDKKIERPVKVSIVVPVCNVEQYLRECLDSCVNQTLQDIEIICVNDGSKDGSLEILKEYAAKDSRVKVINKDNAGYGHTMNIGMDMAIGEYIGIVESDDLVKFDMYETLYNIAKTDDIDMVKADYYRFTDEGGYRHLFYQFLSLKPELYDCVISDIANINMFKFTNTWSGIYKKSYLDKYVIRHQETPGASYQDNGFWFQTTISAEKIYYLSKPFYMNRRDNPNSSVYQKEKVFMATGEYAYIYEFLKKNPQLKQKFQKYYYCKKFDNYFYCYRQVAPEYRKEFLMKFSDEFKNDISKNEIDKIVFGESRLNLLNEIVNYPDEFYKSTKDMDDVSFDSKVEDETVIPIVFICDKGYVIPTTTAMVSMLKFKKKETKYDITIIAVNLSDTEIRNFAAIQSNNVNINIIYIKENLFKNLHSEEFTQFGVSTTALIKFLLPELMSHCDKILYLDGDISVKRDLTELYSNDLGDCYAGVIRDMPQVLYKRQIFGRGYGRDYFNSGVMLLNVKKMREENLTEALIENKKNSSSRLMDQDVLNEVFAGNVKQLSIVYNTLYVNLLRSKGKYDIEDINNYYGTEFKKLEDIRRSSNIIHYCSKDKPWKYYDVPMADYWLEYYFRSAYGNKKLIRSSSLQIQSEANCNGQICISDDKDFDTIYPIVFNYNNNTKEILENISYISSLEKKNEKFDLYLFYKDGNVIPKSIFESALSANMSLHYMNISKIIVRDTEYSANGRLHDNYYRILVPEILCQYDKVYIVDGIIFEHDFRSYLKNYDSGRIVSVINPADYSFWDSPMVIIDVCKFILNITKFKFFDSYNNKRRGNFGFSRAFFDVIPRSQTGSIDSVFFKVQNYYNEFNANNIFKTLENEIKAKNHLIKDLMQANEELNRKLEDQIKNTEKAKRNLVKVRSSVSFKLGKFLTILPRGIKRLFSGKKKK